MSLLKPLQSCRLTHRQSYNAIVSLLAGILSVLILSGCAAGLYNKVKIAAPSSGSSKARELMKLAQETPHPHSLSYSLQAAEHFIQAKEINEAQRALRLSQMMLPYHESGLRKTLLDARLALLKRDYTNARTLINNAVANLNLPTESPTFDAIDLTNDNPGMPGDGANGQSGNMGKNGGIPSNENTPDHGMKSSAGLMGELKANTATRIALILPTKGLHGVAAKTIRDGFLASYYKDKKQNQATHSIKIYDSSASGQIRAAYENALNDKSNIIVGPLTKPEVQSIIQLKQIPIPVLALNTIAEDNTVPSQLYQFGLMPEDEVSAVAEQALKHHRKRALIFAPQTDWGRRLANSFKKYWQSRGGVVANFKYFNAKDMEQKLNGLLQDNADMLFLAASAEQARKIKTLLNNHHSENLAIYTTSTVYAGASRTEHDQGLDGIHFCDMPWMLQHPQQAQQQGHGQANQNGDAARFYALGMDAHQLALQLVQGAGQTPSYSLTGATGVLHINHFRRIQRDLTCAKFEHGVVVKD